MRGSIPLGSEHALLGPTVALTIAVGVAFFAVLVGLVVLLVDAKPLPTGLPLEQRQDAETALYVVAFAVILPAAVIGVPRVADAIAAGPNGPAFSFLAAALASMLVAAIITARVAPGNSALLLLGLLATWWIVAIATLARARRPVPSRLLLQLGRASRPAWVTAGALLLASLLAFSSTGSISLPAIAIATAIACAMLAVYRKWGGEWLPTLSSGWGLAVDALVILVILLACPDLVIFTPEVPGDFLAAFETAIIQFHQNFPLGTVNQVLGGEAVLVDTSSQYGVGLIYALAAGFQVAPIGYGTFGFLDGALFGLFFAAGYGVLRMAGASRPLAVAGLTLAVVVLLYNLVYPVGALPQHGPLRFGLPILVIVAGTVGARWPSRSTAAQAVAVITLGISSIWAVEAFGYTLATFAGVACFQAFSRREPGRLRWLVRQGLVALGACVAVHLLLAGLTLAFARTLPDWTQYLVHVKALLFGYFGQFTYDFAPWSPGLPVAVAYAASAIAFLLVALRRPEIVDRERPAFVALAGVTAYGIALFTYFVNRSANDILPYVSFPALLAAVVWLSLLLRGALGSSRAARLAGLASASSVAVLMVAIAWSSVGERFERTALAHAAPGGDSLTAALDRLWDPPPLDLRSPRGEALLARYLPGQRKVPILLSPDLQTEVLIRSGRANEFPFSHPRQDFFARLPSEETMDRAVAELQAGDRMLIDQTGLRVLAELEANPARDPLADPVSVGDVATGGQSTELTPQQESLLQRIAEPFRLEVLHRDDLGFVVVQLEPRR